ncbi:MAG: Uma2 family endonuclease [Cyanobacteria bacterium J06621_8]
MRLFRYPLTSFLNGVITLMSPSVNHEKIAQIFPILIAAYCRQFKLTYFPRGSTTLKKNPLVGKEPDVSYAFNTDKDIPDLTIEVIFSSGGIEDLEKYCILGVPEVWFWQNNQLTFYRLEDAGYQEVADSICLPKLVAKDLVTFVNRGIAESPLTIEADFIEAINRSL